MAFKKRLDFIDEPPIKIRAPQAEGFALIAPVLMANPDKWAIIAEGEKVSMATNLRTRYPDFEFTVRAPDGKKYNSTERDKIIYACYRGVQWQVDQARKLAEKRKP